jgi:L-threonylcarbamoyladenylate synthase
MQTDFFESELVTALETLRAGGIILYPTDTIWGLGCDATNEAAVSRIYQIKQRADTKSLILLVGDERDLLTYIAAPDPGIFDFLEAQERPTTVIFDHAVNLPSNVIAADGSVAIRLVREDFCRHLTRRLKKPLVSTSANISGQPSPATFSEVSEAIIHSVDHVVKWRQDDNTPAKPSRILRWKNNGDPEVIRD